ncbi:hypothetical protein [Paraflavitalea speifideaquila]|uniref:hypothetical protein n=1 Tax=Paraflavitalea speifideaquila TaxID=3076558 RepID=UPI0028EC752A|nr:hypothetical protein [Paraflavitalea speifideiaquila]
MIADNQELQQQFEVLEERTKKIQQQITELEKRDNEVYRTIFEADPIPDSVRAKEIAQQKENQLVMRMANFQLENSIVETINNLSNRINAQERSYNEIAEFIKIRKNCWPQHLQFNQLATPNSNAWPLVSATASIPFTKP